MTNTALLEKAIANSGYRKSYIAERMKINPYTLAKKIRNETQFKSDEIDDLCRILNLDVGSRMKIFFAHPVDSKST